MNDYTRKGFVDGRAGRLPTIIVRAGKPNGATTGCFSGVIREPLAGIDVELPISGDVTHACGSYRTIAKNLLRLHEASPAAMSKLGVDRTINMPALTVSLATLADALLETVGAAGSAKLGKISYNIDEDLSKIVDGFPKVIDSSRGEELLGMEQNPPLPVMIRCVCVTEPAGATPLRSHSSRNVSSLLVLVLHPLV